MKLLDEVLERAKSFKADGMAIHEICVERDGELARVEFVVTNANPIPYSYQNTPEIPTEIDDDRTLDLYHET